MTDREKIKRLRRALKPFALMDREGEVKADEVACWRGASSDVTIITSQDFRKAAETLAEVK